MGIPTGLVSNADDRIRESSKGLHSRVPLNDLFLWSLVKTLESLDLLPRLITAGATISQHAGCEKPDKKIYELACEAAGVKIGEGVLMVGDELVASVGSSLPLPDRRTLSELTHSCTAIVS
jgi:hypothetical protein